MSKKTQNAILVAAFNILCFFSFEAHSALKTYISYDLEYKAFEEMRLKLENTLGTPLKNRGEAHITVITPPEYKKLTMTLKHEQVHAIANETLVKMPAYETVCVGSGSLKIKEKTEKTYYVVVTAPELLNLRKKLAEAAKLPKDQFDPDLFFPHVTLGFTTRDLHYEDGVIKDKNSCLK
jgi:2'-5' RNA ligase